MEKKPKNSTKSAKTADSERPPVIVVMGHIDHGKSSLLDYIRHTNVTLSEAGGITQHMSAYEVSHISKETGKEYKITFLDTPGHEAFQALRLRGARVADIAILVVSAEEGVKPQTLEALKSIQTAKIPFIVAINKIDRPEANIDRTKQSLAENEIYIEGYGGNIPAVPVSAKTGEGISELLDVMILSAELEELKGSIYKKAEGVILENHLDAKKGISATLIIKDGVLKKGMFVAAGESFSPVRFIEDFAGKKIESAQFSSPVRIIGWNKLTPVGATFHSFDTKKEAQDFVENSKMRFAKKPVGQTESTKEKVVVPLVIKADTGGSLETLLSKIAKMNTEKVTLKIIGSGIGTITERDVKLSQSDKNPLLLGFHTEIDSGAVSLAERMGIEIKLFDIIYELTEWLDNLILGRTPKIEVEEATGLAKVLKIFSKTKDRQIIGGRVESGALIPGINIKIIRREAEIGRGRLRGLQKKKEKADEVKEGNEFGAMVESKIEIAPGDKLEAYQTIQK